MKTHTMIKTAPNKYRRAFNAALGAVTVVLLYFFVLNIVKIIWWASTPVVEVLKNAGY